MAELPKPYEPHYYEEADQKVISTPVILGSAALGIPETDPAQAVDRQSEESTDMPPKTRSLSAIERAATKTVQGRTISFVPGKVAPIELPPRPSTELKSRRAKAPKQNT